VKSDASTSSTSSLFDSSATKQKMKSGVIAFSKGFPSYLK